MLLFSSLPFPLFFPLFFFFPLYLNALIPSPIYLFLNLPTSHFFTYFPQLLPFFPFYIFFIYFVYHFIPSTHILFLYRPTSCQNLTFLSFSFCQLLPLSVFPLLSSLFFQLSVFPSFISLFPLSVFCHYTLYLPPIFFVLSTSSVI